MNPVRRDKSRDESAKSLYIFISHSISLYGLIILIAY